MKTVLSILLFSAIGISNSADAADKELEKEKTKTVVVCGAGNANCAVAATSCDSKTEACQTLREVNSMLRAMVPPAMPAQPIMPPPPPPPPPPPQIVVPTQAHLACSGKSSGSTVTWRFEDKLRITGKCTVRDGKPWLEPEHISSKT